LLGLLKSSSLRRFFAAHFQSELGSGAAYVALALVAYHRLHSGWAIAVVLLADFLPGIVLSAPFGALADRISRRRLVVAAELLRAAALIALAVVPWFAATVALALAAGVGTAMFRPSVNAALPGLLTEEQRSPATALYGALISVGMTVGPALTALVLLVTSPTLVLAANGATFLVSALLLRGVPLGAPDRSPRDRPPGGRGGMLWSSTVDGLRAASEIPGIAALLVICAVSVLAGGLMNVAEPLLAIGPLGAGSAGYSLLVAAYGVGMVAGSLANARAASSVIAQRRRLLWGLALEGLGMIGSATAPDLSWALASFLLTGFSNALMMAPAVRLVYELVSERLLGRIFGLRNTLANVAFVVAFLSAGALLGALGARAVFAFGGGGLMLLAVAGGVAFRPDRRAEPVAAVPEPV
jgi:MFS family permease